MTETGEKIAALKRRLHFLEECGEHTAALDILAELVDMGCRDLEIIRAGLNNYFAVGDLERAAKWADVMLTVVPDDVGARLVIAKLCLVNNRMWDALAVFDFIALNLYDKMTISQRDEMTDILLECAKQDKYTVAFYPNAVDFVVREYRRTELLSVIRWLDTNKQRKN